MKLRQIALSLAACFAATQTAIAAEPSAFARQNYTTPLADVCPNPFIIQKDWLAQAEHGFLYQLIGADGTMSQGRYQGPLGSTGIDLLILEGGGGFGLGDGETAYSALHQGNSKAGVTPHLGYQELDNAFIFSKRFPVVGVMAPLDKSPSALFWDQATYPEGFRSLDDLIAFGKSGKGKIYVSTIKRTFGKYLVEQGVPTDAFVEGYRGDGELFVTNNGTWLNQGFVSSEVYKFENGNNWGKPIDYLLISDMGYSIYTGMLSAATHRLEELSPCLEKLVPLIQQGQVDYVADPSEVNALITAFNDNGYGAGFWKTPAELVSYASNVLPESGVISNGGNQTIGDFDIERVVSIFDLVKSGLDERADEAVKPEDVFTNRFIDWEIGLPVATTSAQAN